MGLGLSLGRGFSQGSGLVSGAVGCRWGRSCSVLSLWRKGSHRSPEASTAVPGGGWGSFAPNDGQETLPGRVGCTPSVPTRPAPRLIKPRFVA